VLTRPAGFSEDDLAAVLTAEWRMPVATMAYRPVGFGSHHWEVADAGGSRWFVTVDELPTRRRTADEPLDAAFARLRGALAAARELRETGHRFVVAPVPTRAGHPVARAGAGFAVAVYPYVEGKSFEWGDFTAPRHRQAVLDLVIAVHAAPPAVRGRAPADDFGVPHRDGLEAALAPADGAANGGAADSGPYAARAAVLLRDHAAAVRRALARYDGLVAQGRAAPDRAVLTHGEPHPGNTMLTADGWRLIDWDTARVAPPERDLWGLDPGDGSVLDAYAAATGVAPLPPMLELYRVRWQLADIAMEVRRFRQPHTGSADDDKSWGILRANVEDLPA
jgi:hypothetical protein